MVYGYQSHFQQYFSFISGGNRRKPPTCHKEKRSYFVVLNDSMHCRIIRRYLGSKICNGQGMPGKAWVQTKMGISALMGMMLNATFNNVSVLLVEETGENHRPATWRKGITLLY
jgi:hypothetical protein